MDATRPTTAERLAAFAMTLQETQVKRERGELLQPILKTCSDQLFLMKSDLAPFPPHSPASVFLASSDPLKVWLSSRAVWSDFFAPARSPFLCCVIP